MTPDERSAWGLWGPQLTSTSPCEAPGRSRGGWAVTRHSTSGSRSRSSRRTDPSPRKTTYNYQSVICAQSVHKKKFRFSTLPKLKYKSMGSFLIGLNNGLVQNKQTYSFWRQSLGVTFVDMEDWTASNSASQTRLSFSPQWFIIGREVVLRGLALPADDDVLPHVEAVLGLSLPPLTLHPRGHNVTRVIRVLHSDSCCDCDCSMLSPPPHCRQSPRSLVSSGSRCTSSLRATSLFSGKYKLW